MNRSRSIICLLIFLFSSSLLFSQADIGLKGVGGKLGLVSIESNVGSTLGLGVFADLGTIIPTIQVGAEIDYWSKSFDNGFSGYESSFRDIALGVNGRYIFELANPTLKPFAQGGISIHLYKSEVDAPTTTINGVPFDPSSSTTSTKFGVDLGGGAIYQLSPKTDLVGELKYRLNDLNHLVISVGALFRMGG